MDFPSQSQSELLLLPIQGPSSANLAKDEKLVDISLESMDTIPTWALRADCSSVASVRTSYLMLLTCGIFGLQGIGSLILASGTPYLLSLGFSRSTTALVWLAGPLSGMVVQPFIGAVSDRVSTRWGKRKPFIVAGFTGSVISMISLALVRIWATRAHPPLGHEYLTPRITTAIAEALAIFWIWMLNLSLQPIQVGLRAFIIDACPRHQQSEASAWTGRFTALGAIATYFLDGFITKRYQHRSFEVLCLIASLNLVLTNLPGLLFIRERVGSSKKSNLALRASRLFQGLVRTSSRMPRKIKNVCIVQFASWLGWFPFLYYSATYVSSLDGNESNSSQPHPSTHGVQAFFFFALVFFCSSLALPWISSTSSTTLRPLYLESTFTWLKDYSRVTLSTLWLFSQILFAICMLSTIPITRTTAGMAMVATAGVSWSITLWVPLALVSAEIATLRDLVRSVGQEADSCEEDQTGALMSIYNAAISAPQVLAGGLCSAIFWALGGSSERYSLSWVLCLGGLASLVAAVLIVRLKL